MPIITDFKSINEFETMRLSARKLSENDFELILPLYQNDQVMQTLGGVLTKDEAREKFIWNLERWEQDGFGSWVWFDKISQQFVGRAGLRRLKLEDEKVVEVGYILKPEYWHQGFATEMALACLEIAFLYLKLDKIVSFTLTTNKASEKVMQKVGFKFERNFIFMHEPHVLYSLLASDYLSTTCHASESWHPGPHQIKKN